jgi:hypothetical protein
MSKITVHCDAPVVVHGVSDPALPVQSQCRLCGMAGTIAWRWQVRCAGRWFAIGESACARCKRVCDACRDNPFGRGFRSMSRGLAQMESPPSIIVFATAPGSTAADGSDRNGTFTKYLYAPEGGLGAVRALTGYAGYRSQISSACSGLQVVICCRSHSVWRRIVPIGSPTPAARARTCLPWRQSSTPAWTCCIPAAQRKWPGYGPRMPC